MLFFSALTTYSQSYIPITNNLQIQSNSNIKFVAGAYSFTDTPADGVIQISGKQNIILDGDSCTVDGSLFQGYMIKINNSSNIIIRNFDSVFGYKYAVYITNSSHITINGNEFCRNKVDSSGWIDVWANYNQALGGGVMMYQTRVCEIYDNVMTMQNDGVAMYHCDSVNIYNNDFSWNTSYGIRMFWTDTCHIYQNNCSHVNRPYTDPSDCAALLMIISNENLVEDNDLSWSGDGVFLGQYGHSDIPNNNRFYNNECSYSPHNAIEATFADGNIYKYNKCNYSDYGMWLGYSFNTIADSNEVIGNYESGIAIDRGFNNYLGYNQISGNPKGIELMEGSNIPGYETQFSHDYFIYNNLFSVNGIGLSSIKTERSHITGNDFSYNWSSSIYLEGISTEDSITGNTFKLPTAYHIRNNSTYDIYAVGNLFVPGDTALISQKIWDKFENPTRGFVIWNPPLDSPTAVYQDDPPCDMAEPGSLWNVYPEAGYRPNNRFADSVLFDYSEKKVGGASVKLVTARGYDMALNYRPSGDSVSHWSLTENDTLYFWVRTIKFIPAGFQYFSIRIGDFKGNYYKYTASVSLLNNAHLNWKYYKFPLSGNSTFARTGLGTMSLDQVNYVEFHADTWDYGFTLWVDGVQFNPCDPVTSVAEVPGGDATLFQNFPNPFTDQTTISYELAAAGRVVLKVYNSAGLLQAILFDGYQQPGIHRFTYAPDDAASPAGLYYYTLTTPERTVSGKMVRIK